MQALLKHGKPLRNDLRAQRRGIVDPLWELLGAGEAEEVRSVDVDDIERDRDACSSPGLGDQLVWDEMWWNLV